MRSALRSGPSGSATNSAGGSPQGCQEHGSEHPSPNTNGGNGNGDGNEYEQEAEGVTSESTATALADQLGGMNLSVSGPDGVLTASPSSISPSNEAVIVAVGGTA